MDYQPNDSRPTIPTWVWIITVFVLILGLLLWLSGRFSGPESVSMQELVSLIEQGQVDTITVVGDRLEVTLEDGLVVVATKHSRDSLAETLAFYGVTSAELEETGIELIVRDQSTWNNLFSIILAVVPVLLVIWIFSLGCLLIVLLVIVVQTLWFKRKRH